MRSPGEPSQPAAPPSMAASSLDKPRPCGHDRICCRPGILLSCSVFYTEARSEFWIDVIAHRRAPVRPLPVLAAVTTLASLLSP
jgi:hypothetical protein